MQRNDMTNENGERNKRWRDECEKAQKHDFFNGEENPRLAIYTKALFERIFRRTFWKNKNLSGLEKQTKNRSTWFKRIL